jgi:outer membrane protein OmpA-like peptidoglycan-associated protein
MRKYLVTLAALAGTMLAGCSTYSLQELRQIYDMQGTPFQNGLAVYYQQLAQEAEDNYDWANSWHFADKGLSAAYGHDVLPEEISQWNVAEDAKPDLEKARADLMAALNEDNFIKQPEMAARAQYAFDCWVKNAEQKWQADAIAQCRDSFIEVMAVIGVPEPIKEAPVAEIKTEKADKKSFVVYFDSGTTALSKEGAKIVDAVAAKLSKKKKYEVLLNGYSDASGDEAANMKLSMKRAQAVQKRLVKDGVKAKHIQLFAYGEEQKKAGKKDEKTHRKVEIILHD